MNPVIYEGQEDTPPSSHTSNSLNHHLMCSAEATDAISCGLQGGHVASAVFTPDALHSTQPMVITNPDGYHGGHVAPIMLKPDAMPSNNSRDVHQPKITIGQGPYQNQSQEHITQQQVQSWASILQPRAAAAVQLKYTKHTRHTDRVKISMPSELTSQGSKA